MSITVLRNTPEAAILIFQEPFSAFGVVQSHREFFPLITDLVHVQDFVNFGNSLLIDTHVLGEDDKL